jgi:hypothetical protein
MIVVMPNGNATQTYRRDTHTVPRPRLKPFRRRLRLQLQAAAEEDAAARRPVRPQPIRDPIRKPGERRDPVRGKDLPA